MRAKCHTIALNHVFYARMIAYNGSQRSLGLKILSCINIWDVAMLMSKTLITYETCFHYNLIRFAVCILKFSILILLYRLAGYFIQSHRSLTCLLLSSKQSLVFLCKAKLNLREPGTFRFFRVPRNKTN